MTAVVTPTRACSSLGPTRLNGLQPIKQGTRSLTYFGKNMKRKDLEDKYHGKWLVFKWENNDIVYIGDSAKDAKDWLDRNSHLFPDELLVIEAFLKAKYIDPLPKEVRLALNRFRRIAYRPMGKRLIEEMDKHFPEPPAVPK